MLDQVRADLDSGRETIVDVRAAGRFAGTSPEPREGMRSGHMPGALSLPYGDLMNPEKNCVMRSAEEIQTLVDKSGIDLKHPLVTSCGSGVTACVLALGLHSIGMVGKFFAEAIEHVDEAPVEAADAAGATRLQVLWHAVLPQVLPQFADVSIYRWEYNFRASTVMGMVGAGGIGFELMGSLRIMQYQEVSAILIVILIMVTLVDGLSGRLRKRFK